MQSKGWGNLQNLKFESHPSHHSLNYPSLFQINYIAGVKPSEVAYTSLARLAAGAGDGDAAYAAAKKIVAGQSLVPRLRSFVPALVAYAAAGRVSLMQAEHILCSVLLCRAVKVANLL